MKRWQLYLRARKPIHDWVFIIILSAIFTSSIIYLGVTSEKFSLNSDTIRYSRCIIMLKNMLLYKIIFILFFLIPAYYLYLDDILLKRTKAFQGTITCVHDSIRVSDYERNPGHTPVFYKLYPIQRKIVVFGFKPFSCYYKKDWHKLQTGSEVEVIYLVSSSIIVDVKVLVNNQEAKEQAKLKTNDKKKERIKRVSNPEWKPTQMTAEEKIAKLLRTICFCGICALIIKLITDALCFVLYII